jgi:AcrR family transcriptional regulator
MARQKQTSDLSRRFPKRARAHETVETIFEATARILQSEGLAGLNTNKIAERAGVSIGAIYGYFPNKDVILLAMARRELDTMRDRVISALANTDGEPDPARRAIRALIKGYSARGKVRRILMEHLFARGGSEEMARPVYEVANVLASHRETILPSGTKLPTPIGLFVLTRAVDSVIRAATYENVEFVHSPAFEDELARLVRGFLDAT